MGKRSRGIIKGFLGGAGKGMAEMGKMQMAHNLKKESDEADDLRSRELNKGKETFTAEQNRLNRESAEGIASKKISASAKDSRTSQMKNAAAMKELGYPDEIADGIGFGALKQIKDEETGDMVLINAVNNKPVGRLTTSGDKKVWVPEGTEQVDTEPTMEDIKAGNKKYEDEASVWESDKSQFGMNESAAKKKFSEEARDKRTAKGGIVNNAAGRNKKPPAADKTKKHQGKQFTADDYKSKLRDHYKDAISEEKIEEMLKAARSAGKIK